jgi:hypothetical protein
MLAKYILAVVAIAFFVTAGIRLQHGDGIAHPQTRTWLFMAIIFAAVSAWLFFQG